MADERGRRTAGQRELIAFRQESIGVGLELTPHTEEGARRCQATTYFQRQRRSLLARRVLRKLVDVARQDLTLHSREIAAQFTTAVSFGCLQPLARASRIRKQVGRRMTDSTPQSAPVSAAVTESRPSEQQASLGEREFLLKQRETSVHEAELELKKLDHSSAAWRSPLMISIVGATLAVFGNAALAWWSSSQQRELEAQTAEHALILEAIKTGNVDLAHDNLVFLVDSGLVSNEKIAGRLKRFLDTKAPGTGPTLPAAGVASSVDLCEQLDHRAIAINAKGYIGTIGPKGIGLAKSGAFTTESVYRWVVDGRQTFLHDKTTGVCKDNTITMTRLLIDGSTQVYIGRLFAERGQIEMSGTFPFSTEAARWQGSIVDAKNT